MVLVSKPIKQVGKIEALLGKLDFIVPNLVIEELEQLADKAGPKRSALARTAIELTRARFKEVRVGSALDVDDSIVEYALENKCAVATVDTNLRRRLITNEVLVLTLSRDRFIVANPKIKANRHP